MNFHQNPHIFVDKSNTLLSDTNPTTSKNFRTMADDLDDLDALLEAPYKNKVNLVFPSVNITQKHVHSLVMYPMISMLGTIIVRNQRASNNI